MKADHPRAIDRYIDFFGDGTGLRVAAFDPRQPALPEERKDLAARDDQPRP
jgi:hypothetical protein